MWSLNNDLIIIPAKKFSVRCPGKNKILLPFISKYLRDNINRTVLISDCDDLIKYGKSLGLHTFKSEVTNSEFIAIYDYLKNIKYSKDSFIHLPLTQPLRELNLIKKLENIKFETGLDFITSRNKYCNRELFQIDINNSFVNLSKERKGFMCNNIDHVDGAIYKIRYNFLHKVVNSNNPNSTFWSGNFITVENNIPFLDIDEVFDLDKFFNLIELINLIRD